VGPVERSSNHTNSHRFHSELGELVQSDSPRKEDRVEVSEHARYLNRLRELPAARFDHVSRIRLEIEHGTYDTERKIEIALQRLVDDLVE
jgi:hypothetical protein